MKGRAPGGAAVAVAIVASLLAVGTGHARVSVGDRAPWFRLKTITGRAVTARALRGKAAVLVVGLTYASAPPCKKWVVELTRRTGARVYQVIVADKPWYIPRAVVMGRIKDFTPPRYHDRVLIEWYRVFADRYGVPKSDEPTLFVIDREGWVKQRLSGKPTRRMLQRVQQLVDSID